MTIKDEHAYPMWYDDGPIIRYAPGLTKREYAAIQIRAAMEAPGIFGCADDSYDISPAEYAVREADALLDELEKSAK